MRSNKTLTIILLLLALQPVLAQNTEREVLVLIDSAKHFMRSNRNPSKALTYCNAVHKEARPDDLWARAKSFEISGIVYNKINHQDSAIIHLSQALYNYNTADTTDWYESYIVCRNIASIHRRFNLFNQAGDYYDSALYFIENHLVFNKEVSEKYNDHNTRDLVKYYRARNMYDNGQWAQSFKLLHVIGEDSSIKMNTRLMALNAQGVLYKEIDQLDSARNKYFTIIENKSASQSYKGAAWHNLAASYFLEGDLDSALIIIDKAIEINSGLKDQRDLFISYLDKGEYLMRSGKVNEAYRMFKKGLSLEVDVSRSRSLFVIYHFLDLVCGDLKRYKESQEWSELYFQTSEAFNEDKARLSLEDKKANILASIQKFEMKLISNRRVAELNNRNDKIKFVAAVVMVMAIMLFYWFYKRKKAHHKKGKKALSEDISSIVLSGIDPPEPEREEDNSDKPN